MVKEIKITKQARTVCLLSVSFVSFDLSVSYQCVF